MENISKLSLEYQKHVNNSAKHKRQADQHIMNKTELQNAYERHLCFLSSALEEVNNEFDNMGFEDLTKYEKWLLDVHE